MLEQAFFHTAALLVLCFSLAGDTWRKEKKGPLKFTKAGWGTLILGVAVFVFGMLFDYKKEKDSQLLKDVIYLPLIGKIDEILSADSPYTAEYDKKCEELRELYSFAQGLITEKAGNEINIGLMLGGLSCTSERFFITESDIFLVYAIQNLCADAEHLRSESFCTNWLRPGEQPMKFEAISGKKKSKQSRRERRRNDQDE